jgi:hypothetical protein
MEKTPSSALTDDERFLIEQIVARFAVLYAHTVARYKTPQGLAKALLKMLSSKKHLTMEALLCGIVDEHLTKPFFPQDLSKQLLQVTCIPGTYDYWNDGRLQTVKFVVNIDVKLKPKELTQILKTMTSLGILVNVKGLKKIKEMRRNNFDNRKENKRQVINRRSEGGYPSAYTFTPTFHKLVTLVEKHEAMTLFKDILITTNLAFKFEKFFLEGLFYLCKIDKKNATKFIETSWPEILRKKGLTPPLLVDRISLADEKDLERHSVELAKLITTKRSYEMYFILGAQVLI